MIISVRKLAKIIPNWAYNCQLGISNLLLGIIYPIGKFREQIPNSKLAKILPIGDFKYPIGDFKYPFGDLGYHTKMDIFSVSPLLIRKWLTI